MNYISLNIAFSDNLQAEILTAELADYPFESFEADAGTLKAYIPQEQLADCKGEVDALLAHYGVQGRYIAIETQNWNAVGEPVDAKSIKDGSTVYAWLGAQTAMTMSLPPQG